jgi:hypothetical protein
MVRHRAPTDPRWFPGRTAVTIDPRTARARGRCYVASGDGSRAIRGASAIARSRARVFTVVHPYDLDFIDGVFMRVIYDQVCAGLRSPHARGVRRDAGFRAAIGHQMPANSQLAILHRINPSVGLCVGQVREGHRRQPRTRRQYTVPASTPAKGASGGARASLPAVIAPTVDRWKLASRRSYIENPRTASTLP